MSTPVLLHIETSTNICSVALSQGNRCLGVKESSDDKSHAALLTIFIEELLKENDIKPADIDAVAVSMGPGSYTGLRIGVSTAKGICYGTNAKLIPVNTLKAMAIQIKESDAANNTNGNKLYAPMIDARRMEVYSAFFNDNLDTIKDISADIIDENSYAEYIKDNTIVMAGNGAAKCKEVLTDSKFVLADNIVPSAKTMIPLALEDYNNGKFADVAYFEPFYLKDFVATTPKKKFF